jgi:lipid II:glycine glycyltransferase (peptidoglycan interpeptide bridge formation enzyme)
MISAASQPELIDARQPMNRVGSLESSAVAWSESTGLEDQAWDEFLESVPMGQFQQSSRWAQAKSAEGWRPIRRTISVNGRISSGFQILARATRFGRIGYISKGPVLAQENPAGIDAALTELKKSAQASQLTALVVQPPDQSTIDGATLRRHRLVANHLVNIIRATLLVDLSEGMEPIGRYMRKNTWVEIRQAKRRGITIREGTDKDIPEFFRLLLATCERQQTKPAPSNAEALAAVWKAFEPARRIRLSIAEYSGEIVAGALCIGFGSRMTIWKKGWSGRHRERHPSQFLLYDAIDWAARNGYKLFDFAALSPDIAKALLQGVPLSEHQKKSRDFVHLSYGNKALLLPEDRVYIPNQGLRSLYRYAMKLPLFRTLASRLTHS